MRAPNVSIASLKGHELLRTLRALDGKDYAHGRMYLRLLEIEKRSRNYLGKVVGSLTLGFLILRTFSLNGSTGLTVADVAVSVPTAYLSFFLSVTLLFSVVAFLSWLIILQVRSYVGSKIRKNGVSTQMLPFVSEFDDTTPGFPLLPLGHLSEVLPTSQFLTTLLAIAIFPLSMIIPIMGYELIEMQASLFSDAEISLAEKAASFIGVFVVLSALPFSLLFCVPLPMRKNQSYIRWNFLYPLYGSAHPQLENWVKNT